MTMTRHCRLRGTGHIQQDRYRKIALLRSGLSPDSILTLARGKEIDLCPHCTICVDVVAVEMT